MTRHDPRRNPPSPPDYDRLTEHQRVAGALWSIVLGLSSHGVLDVHGGVGLIALDELDDYTVLLHGLAEARLGLIDTAFTIDAGYSGVLAMLTASFANDPATDPDTRIALATLRDAVRAEEERPNLARWRGVFPADSQQDDPRAFRHRVVLALAEVVDRTVRLRLPATGRTNRRNRANEIIAARFHELELPLPALPAN